MNKAIKKSVFMALITILLICFTLPSLIYADTTKIVFSSYRDGETSELYIMNEDGSNPVRLTNNTGNDSDSSFSSDGSKIVFDHDMGSAFVSRDIFIMNSDGSDQINISNEPDYDDYDPSISPDGSKIVFTSIRDGDEEIYIMNSDGSGTPVKLTDNTTYDGEASFSPDGSKIVFTSYRDAVGDNYNYEIYIMNSDGTNQQRLTSNSAGDFNPSFSPDGSKITFISKRDSITMYGPAEIYTMDSDGSDQINISNEADYDDCNPAFTPDGSKIVFTSNRDGDDEIYIMNADGNGTPVNLTNNTAEDGYPSAGIVRSSGSSGGASNHQLNEQSLSGYGKTPPDFVTFLYNRILNRAPDEEGYKGWVEALVSNELSAAELVCRFINSDECQADISGYNNEQFITFLYKVLFNRAPDTEGYENWLGNMNEGMNKNEVITNFCNTTEFEDLCSYFGDV